MDCLFQRSVGEIFVAVGTKDPRYNTMGGINSFMGRQIVAYAHEYLYTYQVHTIPISILHCIDATSQGGTSQQQAITDLAWISFFLLFCPDKYFKRGTNTVSTPLSTPRHPVLR